jgi:phospholipid/cholesterol/gamma-HCH transport system substrate-binding protein
MENSRTATKVGLFVLLALILTALLLVNFSKGRGLFTPSYRVVVGSENVGGLKAGASVLMSGVPVGSVDSIELTGDGRSVLIITRILKQFSIHADARFEIEQSGFLGDQYVSIVAGKNAEPLLHDGDKVQAQLPFNLQEAARSALGLMSKLDAAVARINGAVDRVDHTLLSDSVLTNLSASAIHFRAVSERAEALLVDAQGLVHDQRPVVATVISNFNTTSVSLVAASSNLQSMLDSARPELQATLHSTALAVQDIKLIAGDLQSGRGMAGAIFKDEALKGQFNAAVANFNTVSSNLARFGFLYTPKQKHTLTNDTHYTGRGAGR